MCIGAIAVDVHPTYPVVFVFNRDEAFERPCEPLSLWTGDNFGILAGKDTMGNGTWLGVSADGHLAAILNYWEMGEEKQRQAHPTMGVGDKSREGFMTRGDIPLRLLRHNTDLGQVMGEVWGNRDRYKSFNLLYGDLIKKKIWICSHNYSSGFHGITEVKSGVFGISNNSMDKNWEKVEKLKGNLTSFLTTHEEIQPTDLVRILADKSYTRLEPGVHPEENSIFVPTFLKEISGAVYNKGTVSSTVVLCDRNNRLTVLERSYDQTQTAFRDIVLERNIRTRL